MRTMIFGCPHVQPGVTLGSAALQQTVLWLVECARTHQVTHVVCLGDTIDSVAKTDLTVNLQVKWFLDQFKALAATGVQVFWLIGNHDVYSEAYTGLDIFETAANFTIVKEPLDIPGGEAHLAFLPFQSWMDSPAPGKWQEHLEWVYASRGKDKPKVVFTHVPIEGMPLGGTKDKGVGLTEMALQFDNIFAGHYHIANQDVADALADKVPLYVPGAVMGQDFKDLGWFHGALLWDYTPGLVDAPKGTINWLVNPYSHYFYKGDQVTLHEALKNPQISALRERLHVRLTDKEVDAVTLRELGISTIQVRPKHEQRKTSGQESFKLEGDPVVDLTTWLQANGCVDEDTIALGRQYLA